jgi:hypothetical protein
LLGAIWVSVICVVFRFFIHFLSTGKLLTEEKIRKNLIIVGNQKEYERTLILLQKAQVETNIIGAVYPGDLQEVGQSKKKRFSDSFLGSLYQLPELVNLYKIEEIIFCGQDISTQSIIRWMSVIGSDLDYKILPSDSLSIIGSNSKNSAGDLYTVEVRFKITTESAKRNKRILDIFCALFFLFFSIPMLLLVDKKLNFLKNIFSVLFSYKSWVSYNKCPDENGPVLPKIKSGVLSPVDALDYLPEDPNVLHQLNLLYAKDYSLYNDLDIIWKGRHKLGLTIYD